MSLVGYGTVVQPSVFLQTRAARAPEYWVKVGSRIFEFCGIPPSALELHPLAPNVMRVVAAYERSMNAPPAKKETLARQEQAPLRAGESIHQDGGGLQELRTL